MESTSLNPQTALNLQLPVAAGAAQGVRHPAAATAERPAAAENAPPPSSTHVTISEAGRSRLAEEQSTPRVAATAVRESASVAQNTPVLSRQEGASVGRASDSTMQASAPNAPSLARTVVGAATPTPGAVETPTTQPPALGVTLENGAAEFAASPSARPMAAAEMPAPTAAQSPNAQQAQQQTRQVDAAQSRQDSPSVLAQSGLTDNRNVLSS